VTAYSEDQVRDLARRAYLGGTASFAFERSQTALLVVDMQDEFVRPGWTPFWVPEATRLVPRLRELIERCRALGVPVLWTVFSRTHHYLDRPAAGAFMPNRYPEIGAPDPAWFREGRIWSELGPRADEIVVHKPSYGAFWDTPLEQILSNLRRDTIVVVGTLTNFCCGATARQGYERGFKVVVASDLTATDDPDLQEAELQVLRKGFARVLSAAEIEATLASPCPSASSADTPR
jgi:nicotinamidase-related amidase